MGLYSSWTDLTSSVAPLASVRHPGQGVDTHEQNRRWLPELGTALLNAAINSSACPGNDTCSITGPSMTPIAAMLPPLPAGLLSVRVSYATTTGGASGQPGADWAMAECKGCFWVGSTQMEPARLIAASGPGAGSSRGADFTGIRTGEHDDAPSSEKGFGSTAHWFDVDGDGQLDAIVAQRGEQRFVNTIEKNSEGVIYVLFLDWRNRRQGESIEEWRERGPMLRQDVYGYGGGLGYAAYRMRRMVVAELGLESEGESLEELVEVGGSIDISRSCVANGTLNGTELWFTVGAVLANTFKGGFWRFAVSPDATMPPAGKLPIVGSPVGGTMRYYHSDRATVSS